MLDIIGDEEKIGIISANFQSLNNEKLLNNIGIINKKRLIIQVLEKKNIFITLLLKKLDFLSFYAKVVKQAKLTIFDYMVMINYVYSTIAHKNFPGDLLI